MGGPRYPPGGPRPGVRLPQMGNDFPQGQPMMPGPMDHPSRQGKFLN